MTFWVLVGFSKIRSWVAWIWGRLDSFPIREFLSSVTEMTASVISPRPPAMVAMWQFRMMRSRVTWRYDTSNHPIVVLLYPLDVHNAFRFKYTSGLGRTLAIVGFLVVAYFGWLFYLAKELDRGVKTSANEFLSNPQSPGIKVNFEGEIGSVPPEFTKNCKVVDEYQQISGAPYGFTAMCPNENNFSVVINTPGWVDVRRLSK